MLENNFAAFYQFRESTVRKTLALQGAGKVAGMRDVSMLRVRTWWRKGLRDRETAAWLPKMWVRPCLEDSVHLWWPLLKKDEFKSENTQFRLIGRQWPPLLCSVMGSFYFYAEFVYTNGRKTKGEQQSFSARVVKHFQRSSRDATIAPPLGTVKVRLNGALSNAIYLKMFHLCQEGLSRWPLKDPYNPNHSVILLFSFSS